MQIERLTRAQLSAVAEIERLCFAEPWSEKALELLLTEAALGMVAVEEGEVLAYGGMLLAPGEGQITNIATHPTARRRGAARQVLETLLAEAWSRDCEQVSLEVRASNLPAIALYETAGFTVAGRRRNFYRAPTEDALVMLRAIPAEIPMGRNTIECTS